MKKQQNSFSRKEILAKQIREVRLAKRWTLKILSVETGISESQLSGLEYATKSISLERFCLLCDVLKTTPNDLLGYVNRTDSLENINYHISAIESHLRAIKNVP